MRWSENETYQFVKLYLDHEYLWNPVDIDYRIKPRRQQGYKEIIKDFHAAAGILLTEKEVKSKIKALRMTYFRELVKKKQRSRLGRVHITTTKWFTEWHHKFKTLKNRVNDMSYEELNFDDDSCQNVCQDDLSEDEIQTDPLVSCSDDDYFLILKSEKNESSEERDQASRSVKKTKVKLHSSGIENSAKTHSSYNMEEDEFDIYGKYIASQLRKIDMEEAIKVQLEIQSIVSKARLSSLRANRTD